MDSAQAALKVAQRQIDTLRAQRTSQEATLAQAKAQLDQAKLNLSYTTVTADQPGRVVNLSGAVGQYAQAGTNLAMLVPDEIWVVANYKETQLDRMRPGQPVDLEIDAYPERAISMAISIASNLARARLSRCCRPKTRPAITSRLSSGCRSS